MWTAQIMSGFREVEGVLIFSCIAGSANREFRLLFLWGFFVSDPIIGFLPLINKT